MDYVHAPKSFTRRLDKKRLNGNKIVRCSVNFCFIALLIYIIVMSSKVTHVLPQTNSKSTMYIIIIMMNWG